MRTRKLPDLADLPPMTRWFSIKPLAQTGYRDFVARVVGQYSDQRILQAAVDTADPKVLTGRYDHSRRSDGFGDRNEEVWIDYVADTGDGFVSTYSIARLLSADSVRVRRPAAPAGAPGRADQASADPGDVEHLILPAGEILIMGGDQAYPYASDAEYRRRLQQPFDIAVWENPNARGQRSLYAIPGNHDWYDGLSAFDRLFCDRRDTLSDGAVIGAFRCRQHRSYWAIRLPHDWWIWGLDIQLTASLDVGQMQYFHVVSKELPEAVPGGPQAKIVLCIATPSWLEGADKGTSEAYQANLQKIMNLAIDRAKVVAVIAGDWHHYARYYNAEHRVNLITSGGGGAYLAPTHTLPNRIRVPWATSSGEEVAPLEFSLNGPTSTAEPGRTSEARPEAVYPPRRTSRWLMWRLLAFPWFNWSFCTGLGTLYALMYWFYTSADVVALPAHRWLLKSHDRRVEVDRILIGDQGLLWPWQHLYYMFEAGRWQPFFAVTVLFVLWLIYQFFVRADGWRTRLAVAIGFWLVHVFLMAYLADAALTLSETYGPSGWLRVAVTTAGVWVAGGLLAGQLFGIYLFVTARYTEAHADVAFSSIRSTSFKSFLRMRVSRNELRIYPIGLDRVPGRSAWHRPTPEERANGEIGGFVPDVALRPRLIEGPIVIRPADIVDLEVPPRQAGPFEVPPSRPLT